MNILTPANTLDLSGEHDKMPKPNSNPVEKKAAITSTPAPEGMEAYAETLREKGTPISRNPSIMYSHKAKIMPDDSPEVTSLKNFANFVN